MIVKRLCLIVPLLFLASKLLFAYGQDDTIARLVICDFDTGEYGNNIGGSSGAWLLNPEDPEQSCYVDFDPKIKRGDRGYGLKIIYDVESPLKSQGGFWTKLLGLDSSYYDHVELYVRGDENGPFSTIVKCQFKKKADQDGMEMLSGSFIIEGITKEWKRVRVPLNKLTGITDWKDIDEFVIVLEDRRLDQKKGALYFDDISLIKTGNRGPSATASVERKIYKPSNELEGIERARYLVKNLKGFPKQLVNKRDFPEDEREFILAVAKDTWRYIDECVDMASGLPLDNVAFSDQAVIGNDTFIGDYTNVTNIGLYFPCVIAAMDLGFITRDDALARLQKVLNTIEKLETYNNFLYNYYDTTTLERTSNFISFVDSGWLTNGLVIARNTFPEELGEQCTQLINKRDFAFFYDEVDQQMYHGFYVNMDVYAEYHYGVFNSEARSGSFLAIGKGDVPEEHWFRMVRVFPPNFYWQSQRPVDTKEVTLLGTTFLTGFYEYRGVKLVPSWGGSLFEVLMPTVFIDEKGLAPYGLGENDKRHIQAHITFALEEKEYPVWGMSPCSVPGGGYSEYGVKPIGAKGYPAGVITPHVTCLSIPFLPTEAVANLRKMLEVYPDIYGEYGFYDSVNVETKQVSYKYLLLDQGMSFLGMANYLTDGSIIKRYMHDEIAQKAKKLIEIEKFYTPEQLDKEKREEKQQDDAA